jgi:hypothetical protein
MYKHTTFLIRGAIMIAAVVTVALYSMNVANAQSTNMTKNMTGSNMTKSMNMTAGGGNMTKSMNMTAAGGNVTKSTHHKTSMIMRAPGA